MKYSLAQQRQAVEHLLALHNAAGRLDSTVIAAARQAVLTIAWLERHQELMRALDRLQRERPDLADLFREFPGAQIADVRPMFPDFNNGAGVE
jgi:chloramphenicol 3-O-phosphotransferase